MFRRSRNVDLEPAQRALAQGQYDVAFALLEYAARRPYGRGAQGQYWLHLAAVYALYADDGVENGLPALKQAVAVDPGLAEHPLYRALYWEFAAYRGGSVGDVKRGVRQVPASADPTAGYHAASALLAAGAPKSAAKRLTHLDEEAVPAYLVWRRWSLLGQCREGLGDWSGAAQAFARAVELAPEAECEPERLSLAGALLELGEPQEALRELERVDEEALRPDERVMLRYLSGRAQLEHGNPNLALGLLREAVALAAGGPGADPIQTFQTALALAQTYVALNRSQDAGRWFSQALDVAPAEDRPYVQHEAAYALIESERLTAAEEMLAEVVSDPTYPHRAEALADLADTRLKMGEFDAAEVLAQQALEMGATAAACLCLGNVAYEYFRLDDAISWFEQAVSASQPGDPVWVGEWGVADEELFRRAHRELAATGDQPLFQLIFTTTHHAPFDIPPDRIEAAHAGESKHDRAVRYV
ncbi:MAG: tetratricopeptide repeat protein, partial [Deinococcales bacterium]